MKGVVDKERIQSAEALADQGAQKVTPDNLNTHIVPELKLTGAKLNKVTQARAYKAIRDQKMKKYEQRRRTKVNQLQGPLLESFQMNSHCGRIYRTKISSETHGTSCG